MKFSAVNLFFLSTAVAWMVPPPLAGTATSAEADIPPCDANSPHPCSCPEGTSYVWIQTYFSWGANAWAVRNLTGNFSDMSWVPQEIKKTIGPDNTVGSLRLTSVALDVGTFDWLEEITEYTTKDDGSFTWAFEVKNMPLDFQTIPGRFEGEWERFEASAISEHQTDVYWTLYGCHTGGTHSFPVFQRYCHDHVHQILADMGAVKGTTTDPFSEIKIGHRSGALSKPHTPIFAYGQPSYNEAQQHLESRKGIRIDEKAGFLSKWADL